MDARSIAATAANKGVLTPATEFVGDFNKYKYHFDSTIYKNRVFDSHGVADDSVELQLGPNIKDWPSMVALTDNLLIADGITGYHIVCGFVQFKGEWSHIDGDGHIGIVGINFGQFFGIGEHLWHRRPTTSYHSQTKNDIC
jgi:hypothetical protein